VGQIQSEAGCKLLSARRLRVWRVALVCLLLCPAAAQEGSSGTVRGVVTDAGGARLAGASVTLTHVATEVTREGKAGEEGHFAFPLLPPGEYRLRAEAAGLAAQELVGLRLEVGGVLQVELSLRVAGPEEEVTVVAQPPLVETLAAGISEVIDERAIAELPLEGRRFSDLTLLAPGVTTDPRGLTSSSVGDLAFGGVRGYHTSFLVDGADNNNAFFAQARGRYRAPYQFSNEVIQEFRVSSNAYGAEQGRSAGAVVNVATKSGTNHLRGTLFYYLRDSAFAARHPYVDFKPQERQHQFGFTLGGPVKRNRAFFFGGWDQHSFRVPTVVRFADGSTVLVPRAEDFEAHDAWLVEDAAERLSRLGGEFESALRGNAGFFKADVTLSPRHFLSGRISTSRYGGWHNVFFDPASPVTSFAISENGEERVRTESALVSLQSALGHRLVSRLRVQFSRDLQQSFSNSAEVRTRIDGVIAGFGRSAILPRRTREYRLHLGETLAREGRRHSLRFGGDLILTAIQNHFPLLFGGQYIFDEIRVNPFTFEPQTFGLPITPLRAYAHAVPRYYLQNFGTADSQPGTREYALFVHDSIRVTERLALSLGLRYDLQTFRTDRLVENPLWPGSGRMPVDGNNFAPRAGAAYSWGRERPVVVRGGYGLFYPRIPQIYNAAVETENGLNRSHLFLDHADFFDRQLFPQYPNPLAACPPGTAVCLPPPQVGGRLTADLSAFAPGFRTPRVHQGSVSVERELFHRLAGSLSYLYVRGAGLIRARDANLPVPVRLSYPVFDESGTEFTGEFFEVDSFSGWQLTPSVECPLPPCLIPLQRPIPQLGEVRLFEGAANSWYHGMTFSVRRRMARGLYFRLGHTWARATDENQDALVAGRPATVENAHSPSERGRAVTDQRHRFVFSWVWEPRPFDRSQPALGRVFNDWKIAGVVTAGSGRPVNARVLGDPNRDGNSANDRLPGAPRNWFTGPNYATTDVRLSRRFYPRDGYRLDLMLESFNLFNRANHRVDIDEDGFLNLAGRFVHLSTVLGASRFPAHYRRSNSFLRPTNAYAPRRLQVALRVSF
jgi:hypothetical protein